MKKTTKKNPVPPEEPVNTCGAQMQPLPYAAPESTSVLLTRKAERLLSQIEYSRSRIKDLETSLIQQKESLGVELLNHQETVHELEKVLLVPTIPH